MTNTAHASIADKVVLLTGSTGPMGSALLDAFLDAGAKLALCVRRMAHLPELEQRLAQRHEHTLIVPCDLRYEENVVRLMHRVVQRFGRIDVIVNAAYILGPLVPIMDYPVDPWRDVIATNLTGTYLVCREALPWMTRQGSGSIINVTTSLTGDVKPQWGAYAVACHAVEGLTRLLAAELDGTGVRVNALDIGEMQPDLTPATPAASWTNAFLHLAGDDSAGRSGECIRAADFAVVSGPSR
jgi:NAD(P)-dependent dehydrogenase (short-subunit alcohol dehydrogenase family)